MSNTLNLAGTKAARRPTTRGTIKRLSNIGRRHSDTVDVANCKAEVQLIADYLTANLDPKLQRSFEKHLSDCSDCSAFLQTYKKTLALTSSFLKREGLKPTLSFAALRAAAQGR